METDLESSAHSLKDTDSVAQPPEFPLVFLFVFGLPLFMTIVWFFLRFTAPDRFGRTNATNTTDDES